MFALRKLEEIVFVYSGLPFIRESAFHFQNLTKLAYPSRETEAQSYPYTKPTADTTSTSTQAYVLYD